MDDLTPTEAAYAAALARAEARRALADAARFHDGHSSRLALEKAAEVYRVIAEKLEGKAGS